MGLAAEKIAKIKSPIGIDIEAETPDEIAISILAEVIAARNS
jgi:xanthine dehydrogenase accessory factor